MNGDRNHNSNMTSIQPVRLKTQMKAPLSLDREKLPPNRPHPERRMTSEEADIASRYDYITAIMRDHLVIQHPDGTSSWTSEPYLILCVTKGNVEVSDYPTEWEGTKVFVDTANDGGWTYTPL
jgi:hypothetical protein